MSRILCGQRQRSCQTLEREVMTLLMTNHDGNNSTLRWGLLGPVCFFARPWCYEIHEQSKRSASGGSRCGELWLKLTLV